MSEGEGFTRKITDGGFAIIKGIGESDSSIPFTTRLLLPA
jgi:hypothetical protein